MKTDRINARLPEALAEHVHLMVDERKLFETPSEYIRDLIRRDMEDKDLEEISESLREGYRDIAAGRYFKSTGNFFKDREIFKEKEKNGWK